MKKMKRFLVAMLGGLTAIACLAGISACKKDKEEAAKPSYDINFNIPEVEIETCVHTYKEIPELAVAGTCTELGYKTLGCTKCGYENTVSTGYVHDFGDASCTEPAVCFRCEYVKDMNLAAHKMVAAACEEDAYCSECDYVEYGTALDHVVVPATCTADSYCSVCNENFGGKHTVVSAFGTLVSDGTWQSKAVVDEATGLYYVAPVHTATKSVEGYAAFDYCATCLAAATDEESNLAWAVFMQEEHTDAEKAAYLFGSGLVYTKGYVTIASEHNYVDVFAAEDLDDNGLAIAPDCVANGLKNFKACLDCATIDVDTLTTEAAIAAAVAVAENATRPALYAVDYAAAVVAKLGHTSVDAEGVDHFVAGTPATCTTDGTQWSAKCQREGCGVEMNSNISVVVTKFGHNAGNKKPTCTEGVKCINCGIIPEEEGFKALGHDMQDAKVTSKPATCAAAGFTDMKKCANGCGYYTFTSVDKLSHDWGETDYVEGLVDEDINCTYGIVKAGVRQCKECHAFGILSKGVVAEKEKKDIYVVGKAPNGKHVTGSDYVAATCLLDAQNVACAVCDKEDAFAKKALGHQYKVKADEATCFTTGKCVRENCDIERVGDATYSVVPEINHAGFTVLVEEKAPTCTADGYLSHEKCTLCDTIFYEGETEVIVGYETVENEKVAIIVKHSTSTTLKLAKIAHVYYTVPEKLPTCEEAGHSEYEECVTCGKKDGYTTNGYAKKACASDIASCYATVACNHSYTVIVVDGEDVQVAKEGKYVQDYVTEEFRLATKAEIEANEGIYVTEWRGCGEQTKTTNKIPCIDHNQDGFCTVCNKAVAHKFDEETGLCDCGKSKFPRQ